MKKNGNTIRGEPAICKESALGQLLALVEPMEDEKEIITAFVNRNTLEELLSRYPELRLSTETEQKLLSLSLLTSWDGVEEYSDF